jgi:citrate lyase subunit beta/citryl-CoA lyase
VISFFACEWVSPERAKARPDSHAKKEITTTKSSHTDTATGTVAGTDTDTDADADADTATATDTATDTDTGADAGTGTGTGTDTGTDAGRMEGPGTYYRTLTTIAVMLSRPPREFAI